MGAPWRGGGGGWARVGGGSLGGGGWGGGHLPLALPSVDALPLRAFRDTLLVGCRPQGEGGREVGSPTPPSLLKVALPLPAADLEDLDDEADERVRSRWQAREAQVVPCDPASTIPLSCYPVAIAPGCPVPLCASPPPDTMGVLACVGAGVGLDTPTTVLSGQHCVMAAG